MASVAAALVRATDSCAAAGASEAAASATAISASAFAKAARARAAAAARSGSRRLRWQACAALSWATRRHHITAFGQPRGVLRSYGVRRSSRPCAHSSFQAYLQRQTTREEHGQQAAQRLQSQSRILAQAVQKREGLEKVSTKHSMSAEARPSAHGPEQSRQSVHVTDCRDCSGASVHADPQAHSEWSVLVS